MKWLQCKDFNKFLKSSRILKVRDSTWGPNEGPRFSETYLESPFFCINSPDFYKFLRRLGYYASCEVGVLAGHLWAKDMMIVKIFSIGQTHEVWSPGSREFVIIKQLLKKKIDILLDLHTHPVEYSNMTVVKAPKPKLLGRKWLARDLIPSSSDLGAWKETREFINGLSQTVLFYVGIIAGLDFILTKYT